jgi:hypothetical protein
MPQEPVGELVGAYRIRGALMENSCGSAALPAADPLNFDVQIRKQNGSGLWLVAAPPPQPGSLSNDGDFRFERLATYDVGERPSVELLVEMDIERLSDPEAARQLGDDSGKPCRLTVAERVAGTLLRDSLDENAGDESDAAGEERASSSGADLIGENEIAVRVAAGSDCRPSLEENGGPFERLPCVVRYELEGELIDP